MKNVSIMGTLGRDFHNSQGNLQFGEDRHT